MRATRNFHPKLCDEFLNPTPSSPIQAPYRTIPNTVLKESLEELPHQSSFPAKWFWFSLSEGEPRSLLLSAWSIVRHGEKYLNPRHQTVHVQDERDFRIPMNIASTKGGSRPGKLLMIQNRIIPGIDQALNSNALFGYCRAYSEIPISLCGFCYPFPYICSAWRRRVNALWCPCN